MYGYYDSAKKALSKGTALCKQANESAMQTAAKLRQAAEITEQLLYMRTSLDDQVSLLKQIADQILEEEKTYSLEFDGTIRELDMLDDELNESLQQLDTMSLPKVLLPSDAPTDGQATGDITQSKSLLAFADDAAVENLKGQLRQVVEDMHMSKETGATYLKAYDQTVSAFDRMLAALPEIPKLSVRRQLANLESKNQIAITLSASKGIYTKQQEEHLQEMTALLLSLSQHYDNSCTLLKADASLLPEELEELQSVVLNDADQLGDVLAELDERVGELEEDVKNLDRYMERCSLVLESSLDVFKSLEEFKTDELEDSITRARKARADTAQRLEILKDQMARLSDHYQAFQSSYHSLLLEIDRRAKYEASVTAFFEETRQTLEALAIAENEKREQFKHEHGDTLPSDIWSGITAKPALYDLESLLEASSTPRLPRDLIATARSKLEKR